MKNSKGITLIALIITIVVLLILAGVSISLVVGDNGVLSQATKAKKEAIVTGNIEKLKVALSAVEIENFENDERKEYNLKDELSNIFEENFNLGTIKEDGSRIIVIETGSYLLKESEVSYLDAGVRNIESIITTSTDEIIFKNTIKKEDIKADYPDYNTYEIIGVSSSEDGEYLTTGTIAGKTGNLNIIGDIVDTTFEYDLESIMLGDEEFFVKYIVDGEEKLQKLSVIQGEIVRYEEDMIELYDSSAATENLGTWFGIERAILSDGKAKKIVVDKTTGKKSNAGTLKFNFVGTRCDLIWGQTETSELPLLYSLIDENGNELNSYVKVLDMYKEEYVTMKLFDGLDGVQNYTVDCFIAYLRFYGYK